MVQYELKIGGRVQGVGYRYFARQKANEIGIKGWVKNTHNNGVVIIAQGHEKDITTFIDYLQIGSSGARVSQISKAKMQITNQFSEFKINH